MSRDVGFDELVRSAEAGRRNAVVVDSRRPAIGAAVRDSFGRIWQAGSLDTPDHVVAQCAERAALFYALTNGAEEITQLVVVYELGSSLSHPCGACLEAFRRFALRVEVTVVVSDQVTGTYPIEELLQY